jgi:hypothetical protein
VILIGLEVTLHQAGTLESDDRLPDANGQIGWSIKRVLNLQIDLQTGSKSRKVGVIAKVEGKEIAALPSRRVECARDFRPRLNGTPPQRRSLERSPSGSPERASEDEAPAASNCHSVFYFERDPVHRHAHN